MEPSGTCTPVRVPLTLLVKRAGDVSARTRLHNNPPSKVNPFAMYYCHLRTSWEEARSQLCLLFFMLSAVLSVSVKRVRLIQGKVAGLPPSPVPALISLLVVLVHSQPLFFQPSFLRDTKNRTVWKFWQTSDNEQGLNKELITECCNNLGKMSEKLKNRSL